MSSEIRPALVVVVISFNVLRDQACTGTTELYIYIYSLLTINVVTFKHNYPPRPPPKTQKLRVARSSVTATELQGKRLAYVSKVWSLIASSLPSVSVRLTVALLSAQSSNRPDDRLRVPIAQLNIWSSVCPTRDSHQNVSTELGEGCEGIAKLRMSICAVDQIVKQNTPPKKLW